MGNLKVIYLMLVFCGLNMHFANIYSQNRILKGKVIDKNTKENITGATISLENINKTISDSKGEFEMTISKNNAKRIELSFSSVGYTPIKVSVESNQFLTVSLEKNIQTLEEVVVSSQGKNIVKEAILKIQDNYYSHNTLAMGIMRIIEIVDSSYYYKGDAKVNVFSPSYSSKSEKQQISIDHIESSSIEDSTKKWFLKGKWVGGFSQIHDLVFTKPNFLQLSHLDEFLYHTPRKKTVNGRVTYEIPFFLKKETKLKVC
ncbi:carboxypeptidase-like regulatory domain-containing protein [Niabella insulamsoli]|uniref:carboxypeptidase-like regulatory domain-containing protein n=1 Tax=Niabella insulamsoli TaxID=3144874 RepID=UPI0031FE2863